jgi:hypothetical protein
LGIEKASKPEIRLAVVIKPFDWLAEGCAMGLKVDKSLMVPRIDDAAAAA